MRLDETLSRTAREGREVRVPHGSVRRERFA